MYRLESLEYQAFLGGSTLPGDIFLSPKGFDAVDPNCRRRLLDGSDRFVADDLAGVAAQALRLLQEPQPCSKIRPYLRRTYRRRDGCDIPRPVLYPLLSRLR